MTIATALIFFFSWVIGALSNGIAGVGCAMIALPIVSSFMPPQLLVPTSVVLTMLISVLVAWQYREYIRYKELFPMFLAAIPGSFVGLLILLQIPVEILQLVAGLLILLFVVWRIIPHKERKPKNSILYALFFGFISGLLNASISFAGAPVAIYAILVGWEKEVSLANLNAFGAIACIVAMAMHVTSGLYTSQMLSYLGVGILAVLIGVVMAKPLAQRIDKNLFTKILLTFAALTCIWRGLGM